jgi:heme O synthase-like polyprenyltransferase
VARVSQRRAQGVLFAFLTVFFAGIAAAAYGAEAWVIAVAAGVLSLWMAGLAIRTFRAAREEMAG